MIVSYNGDLRGVVEDLLHKQRDVRCSVGSFAQLGAVLDGSRLLATVPSGVASQLKRLYPHFAIAPVPLPLTGAPLELLWLEASERDEALTFVRERLAEVGRSFGQAAAAAQRPKAKPRGSATSRIKSDH